MFESVRLILSVWISGGAKAPPELLIALTSAGSFLFLDFRWCKGTTELLIALTSAGFFLFLEPSQQVGNAAAWESALAIADSWKKNLAASSGQQAFRVLDKSFAAQIADFLADPARVAKRHKPSVDVAHIGAADAGSVYDDREFYVELLRGVVLAGAGGVLDEASKWKEAEAVALRRKQVAVATYIPSEANTSARCYL